MVVCGLGYLVDCVLREFQINAIKLHGCDILSKDGVLWLRDYPFKILNPKVVESHVDRKPSNELWNESKLYEVVWKDVLIEHFKVLLPSVHYGLTKSHGGGVHSLFYDLVQTNERTSADEKDVLCVYLYHLLVWMLSPSLWRYACNGAFDYLQKGLLYTFSRDVASYGDVLAFLCDLVHFV